MEAKTGHFKISAKIQMGAFLAFSLFSPAADTVLSRNPEWLEKGLVDFQAIIEVPKGDKHPRFAHLPELESFAKSEKDRKLMVMQRAFRVTGQPFVLARARSRIV